MRLDIFGCNYVVFVVFVQGILFIRFLNGFNLHQLAGTTHLSRRKQMQPQYISVSKSASRHSVFLMGLA